MFKDDTHSVIGLMFLELRLIEKDIEFRCYNGVQLFTKRTTTLASQVTQNVNELNCVLTFGISFNATTATTFTPFTDHNRNKQLGLHE